jgi:hypothetical protein
MAKARQKKPNPSQPPSLRFFPMSLKPGDILADEDSEWRVISHPYTAAGGKTVNVRVECVKQSGTIQVRAWGAQERVAVRRG